jgi:hypothetical protein
VELGFLIVENSNKRLVEGDALVSLGVVVPEAGMCREEQIIAGKGNERHL